MQTKTCRKCGIEQLIDNFYKDRTKKDGHDSRCKSCSRLAGKLYYKQYYQENKSEILAYNKQYDSSNSDKVRKRRKAYRADNLDHISTYMRQYYQDNKGVLHAKEADRKREYPQIRLASNLRSRLRSALRRSSKAGSAVKDLGCSISQFQEHLSSKFQSGMSWDNYGAYRGGWTIDHIIPLDAFDLSDRQHVVLSCHYLNLQPMWYEENISKGNKIIPQRTS